MHSEIVVRAPAHLHVGNIDLTGNLERLYGTIGFTIDTPHTLVRASISEEFEIEGEDAANATRYAEAFFAKFGVTGGAMIKVERAIPKHVGMGSQTALALSIATALSRLYCVEADVESLALFLGRGSITGLGVHSFKVGGFIVDGGFKLGERGKKVPPLVFHHKIPEELYFVVCIPAAPIPEVLRIKAAEESILEQLKPMPQELSSELARITLIQMLPALVENDVKTFGKAITSLNGGLGRYWSDHQHGIYCHPLVDEGVKLMLEEGALGACQSCWGPTFYGLVEGEDEAGRLADRLRRHLATRGGGEVFYAHPNNSGASVVCR
ncbi:MAG: GHMP kinase [Candidatus Bathyarchaeia archaeon]